MVNQLKINRSLMEEFSGDLINDDSEVKIVYDNSRDVKKLLEKKGAIIPEIGRYLVSIQSTLSESGWKEKERMEEGWIMLLVNITKENKIDTGSVILGYNLQNWTDWAYNYKPI